MYIRLVSQTVSGGLPLPTPSVMHMPPMSKATHTMAAMRMTGNFGKAEPVVQSSWPPEATASVQSPVEASQLFRLDKRTVLGKSNTSLPDVDKLALRNW